MGRIFPIPKGHLSFIHIQLDPDPFETLLHLQHRALICKGGALAFAQSNTPHTTVRRQRELLFTCHCLLAHTHDPRGTVPDHHVPSVFTGSVTFGAQDEATGIKALGVVGDDEWLGTFFGGGQVCVQAQPGRGCVWIKDNGICRRVNTSVRWSKRIFKSRLIVHSLYLTWSCRLFQILKLKAPTCFPTFKRESSERHRSSRVHWALGETATCELVCCVSLL